MNKIILSLLLLFYVCPVVAIEHKPSEPSLEERLRAEKAKLQASKQQYMQVDESVVASYEKTMANMPPRQLKFMQDAAAGVTSETGEIVRATIEDYIVNAFLTPKYISLSVTNIISLTNTTSLLKDDIKDFLDINIASRNPGDTKTSIYRLMGNNIRLIESLSYKFFM